MQNNTPKEVGIDSGSPFLGFAFDKGTAIAYSSIVTEEVKATKAVLYFGKEVLHGSKRDTFGETGVDIAPKRK